MKSSIIVIPGLGGDRSLQKTRSISRRWNDQGSTVYVFDSRWHTPESSDEKLERLQIFFDKHASEKTYVVGYSAGGALAMALYQKRSTADRLILISSKLKNAHKIGPAYEKRAPALIPIVRASENVIEKLSESDRQKIICLRPFIDEVVPKRDMIIKGAKVKRIPFVGHAASIGFALLFQVRGLLRK